MVTCEKKCEVNSTIECYYLIANLNFISFVGFYN